MLLYLQTQVRFPLGGKSVTCRGAEVTNYPGKLHSQNDQVVLLETAASLRASQRQANDFFAFFLFWRRYIKTPLDLNVALCFVSG